MFAPESFFSLESFLHRGLWKRDNPAWSALDNLNNYLEAISHRIEIEIPEGVYLENAERISIGAGATIEPGVLIQGPCIIGKHCTIRHGAYVRSGTILGEGCSVGHASEVKRSILLDGAQAAHLCYVGDSILGRAVNLGAGVKCANLRLDRKEVSISQEGGKVRTGLKKLGAIIGDGAQIGCNCVLNPGTLIGKETVSHPLLNLGGFIPARSRVAKARDWTVEPAAEKILERLLQ
jgi:NDP-sugar pyrophosphorylase family protein